MGRRSYQRASSKRRAFIASRADPAGGRNPRSTDEGKRILSARKVGRVTVVEQPDALVITAPFLSRGSAAALLISMLVIFVGLPVVLLAGRDWSPIGYCVLVALCGYFGLVMALDRTVTTIRRDRVVVVHGPIPMWPKAVIDTVQVVDVHATVITGITRYGGRTEYDTVVASLANGRSAALVDSAGDARDAETLAAQITTWIASH